MTTETGVCVRFGPKGFGFIADNKTGQQYFVHVRNTVNRAALEVGDRVEFETTIGPKGLSAINVRVLPALTPAVKP